jgi:hypothetical protein
MVVVNDLHSSMERIKHNISHKAAFMSECVGMVVIPSRYDGCNVIPSGSIVNTSIKSTYKSQWV